MNNQEYILKSELKKMIDEKINIANWDDKQLLKELLSELDNLSGVSGWIPVTERLPDFTGEVFIYRHNNASKGFFVCYGPEKPYFFEDDVTHWMPLPPHP